MLIEFKVGNFQCFRDEVVLSLVPAGQDRLLAGNIWQGRRYRALKSAALFGPNASGKTSLLYALYVFRRFVVGSATEMTVGDPIPGIEPFRLSAETREKPSTFDVLVELDGAGFRYRIEATRKHVVREKLMHQAASEGAKWLTLIDRDETRSNARRCILHDRIGTPARREQIIEDTRPNALILSRAAERNVEVVRPIFTWFQQRISHSAAGPGAPPDQFVLTSIAETAADDPEFLANLTDVIRDADTGVIGLQTEPLSDQTMSLLEMDVKKDAPAEVQDAISRVREAVRVLVDISKKRRKADRAAVQFFTEHQGAQGEIVRFELDDESAGTLRFLALVAEFLEYCRNGNLVIVDELDTSLHPYLVRRIVELAHSLCFYGGHEAQLVFSTHDVTIMDPTLMRRDQIFLLQKKADGASELYSLWDLERMPRNKAAWAKNYLAGRFGAVPVFGPFLADIPQADEPTEVSPRPVRAAED